MRGEVLQEGATEPEKPMMMRRHWKPLVISLVVILILIGSLVYYVLPRILNPPMRRDSVPTGAYVVPWMQPQPNFGQIPSQFNIDSVMANALKLNMTFRIVIWNGSTRIITSTVYFGHDSKYLYVGGKFRGMYSNPASIYYGDTQPNRFQIYFDVDNDGVLRTPEAGSMFAVNIDVPQETLVGASWDDMVWAYAENVYGHTIWMPAENYLWPRSAHVYSTAGHVQEYDSSTGTVTVLFSRFLNAVGAEDINALQMKSGERWTMGFLLELQYQKELDNKVDGWPRNIYPYLSDDSSWWPKLVIDLTNPPANM